MITRATWPSGATVVYRSLTWGEYREVSSLQGPPAEKALELYKRCVTEGPREDKVPAGIMMWIYQSELGRSPFSGSFQAIAGQLDQARAKVTDSYLLCAQAMIASVFKISFEEMNAWDANTFLTRLSQAEFISGVPLNPVDPTAPKDKKGNTRRKKPLTPAQQKVMEKRSPTAGDLISQGKKPSQYTETEVEHYHYESNKPVVGGPGSPASSTRQ